jgi:SAM-dependent methyltransferase
MLRSTAHVYDLAYSKKDYEGEAADLRDVIRRHNPAAATLLDVACGTGRHLQYLQEWFSVAGVDLDPGMVGVAQKRLHGVAVAVADMRTLDLGRQFDSVACLFSSVGYMRDPAELRQAITAMRAHLAPGGVLVVDGWVRPDRWIEGTTFSEAVCDDGVAVARAGRSWREGRHSHLEIHYLVATADGVEQLVDRHQLTLFSEEDYRSAFSGAGLTVQRMASPMCDRDRYVSVAR